MIKDKGAYIVLDLTARMIARREKEQLEPQAIRDFAEAVLVDPFYDQHPEDSERWLTIFEEAMAEEYMLYCILLVTRFAGTKLVDGGAYWKLEPIMHTQDNSTWWTQERWEDYRRDVLMPWADALRKVLLKNGK